MDTRRLIKATAWAFFCSENSRPPGPGGGVGNLRTANWRTGNMRTNSANYGREPRVQCEPESANFLCN